MTDMFTELDLIADCQCLEIRRAALSAAATFLSGSPASVDDLIGVALHLEEYLQGDYVLVDEGDEDDADEEVAPSGLRMSDQELQDAVQLAVTQLEQDGASVNRTTVGNFLRSKGLSAANGRISLALLLAQANALAE